MISDDEILSRQGHDNLNVSVSVSSKKKESYKKNGSDLLVVQIRFFY